MEKDFINSPISLRTATLEDLKTIQQFGFELLNFKRQHYDQFLDINWPFSAIGEQKYREAITHKYIILAEQDNQPIGFLIGKIIESPKDSAR